MRIIDIAICVDNKDPKGIGRIRWRPYGTLIQDVVNTIPYKEWDENDPFIAIAFLPAHINIIPQINQSVKLVKYDTEKDYQNVEYVAGPFSSPHDLQNQTFLSQHRDTTFGGDIVKDIKDIRDKNGKFNGSTSPEAIIDERDIGFRGNYGSDMIFTENGIQLRGGMLISKESGNKKALMDYPQMSKKMGRLSLKKFPKTVRPITEVIDSSKIAVSKLKYIVEYEINSLSVPTELKLFIYKVIENYGTRFNTDVFGDSTTFDSTNIKIVKLINSGNTLTDASYIKPLDGTIASAYIELREALYLLDINGSLSINGVHFDENIHPFFYRPTSSFRLLKGTTDVEKGNKSLFLSKIQVRNKIGGSGLIYSRNRADPPRISNKKSRTSIKEIKGEQSFSNLSSDKIYITSTSPNVGTNVKSINFNDLNKYELTQEDYVSRIEPNTYATVRGDILYDLLVAIKNLLDSHIHNINKRMVQTDDNWIKLNALMKTLRDDMLNDSIRIN